MWIKPTITTITITTITVRDRARCTRFSVGPIWVLTCELNSQLRYISLTDRIGPDWCWRLVGASALHFASLAFCKFRGAACKWFKFDCGNGGRHFWNSLRYSKNMQSLDIYKYNLYSLTTLSCRRSFIEFIEFTRHVDLPCQISTVAAFVGTHSKAQRLLALIHPHRHTRTPAQLRHTWERERESECAECRLCQEGRSLTCCSPCSAVAARLATQHSPKPKPVSRDCLCLSLSPGLVIEVSTWLRRRGEFFWLASSLSASLAQV